MYYIHKNIETIRQVMHFPEKWRPSWILFARSQTTQDTAWQTAKMESAQKTTPGKYICQL